jgi:dephospho-CoA kinase
MRSSVWGLTGGIASGKSTVAKLFAAEGFQIFDADELARELSRGAAQGAILSRFGTADRKALRDLVFQDPKARSDLESILHPLIREATEQKILELSRHCSSPILYEATLLVETGRYRDFEGLITVSAPVKERRTRLIARDPSVSGVADQIIAAQLTDADREAVADFVIRNDGAFSSLKAQAQKIAKQLIA